MGVRQMWWACIWWRGLLIRVSRGDVATFVAYVAPTNRYKSTGLVTVRNPLPRSRPLHTLHAGQTPADRTPLLQVRFHPTCYIRTVRRSAVQPRGASNCPEAGIFVRRRSWRLRFKILMCLRV
ncbi:hypothetical protein EDC01DRAFT_639475 [Geopyxis carbonaria]|nr:hypothetical protein EDC01DRAFT_639475 [Geopyxis carbonaria]